MSTFYSFTRIVKDGQQYTASLFNGWEEARRHIAECHRMYGRELVALGMVSTQEENGRLVDFSTGHYTPSEVAEIAEQWAKDQAAKQAKVAK